MKSFKTSTQHLKMPNKYARFVILALLTIQEELFTAL